MIPTNNPNFKIRFAREEDTELILHFIKELADYEKLAHEVAADKETLRQSLFGERKTAEVVFGEYKDQPVSFALFFHNFSTFLGKPGLYLEDLYVMPEFRGMGIGKIMLSFLADLALQRNCGRLEWWCLDWNQPALDFYQSVGAEPMEDWTVQRVSGKALQSLAGLFK